MLPTFRDTPDEAFAAATEAVAAGVDGVFCYDHIWPIGQPERPALAPFPILGALATMLGPSRGPGEGPYPRHPRGADRAGPQRGARRAVRRARGTGPGAGHRRARHRRQAERGGEPRLRHPLRAGGRSAGREMVELGRELARAGLPVWMAGGRGRADGGGPGRRRGAQPCGTRSRRCVAERTAGPDGRGGHLGRAAALGLAPVAETVRALHAAGRHAGPSSAGRSTSRSWPRRRHHPG